MTKKGLFLIAISFIFSSCVGLKTGTSGKISKYIEDFYLGDGNMQYFVKPIDYSDKAENITSLDATFRRIDKKTDSVTVNFNVNLKVDNEVNTITIKKNENVFETSAIETFFTDKNDELINHRLSIKVPYDIYLNSLLTTEHSIIITSETDNNTLTPTKQAKKTIPIIKEKINDFL